MDTPIVALPDGRYPVEPGKVYRFVVRVPHLSVTREQVAAVGGLAGWGDDLKLWFKTELEPYEPKPHPTDWPDEESLGRTAANQYYLRGQATWAGPAGTTLNWLVMVSDKSLFGTGAPLVQNVSYVRFWEHADTGPPPPPHVWPPPDPPREPTPPPAPPLPLAKPPSVATAAPPGAALRNVLLVGGAAAVGIALFARQRRRAARAPAR